ncbi:MAG: T9SS type A sorting domain-containing protein [Saprospiraceae bacterium]
MKNLTLFYCFSILLSFQSSIAQPSQFFPTKNASWENATIGFAGVPFPDYQVICGDTIIGNNTYSQLYSIFLDTSGVETMRQYFGGTRMEADLVFYIENNSSTEYLLYDFSLETGQTITVQTIFGSDETLTATSNMLIDTPDGVTRRVINFDNESWIEGIGSTRGLITRGLPITPDLDPYLNCFKSFEQLGYSNPNTQPECLFTFTDLCGTTPISDLSKNEIVNFKVFPNPISDESTIEVKGILELKSPVISIYNHQGQIVEKIMNINEDKFIFSRKNLKAGVYIFELSDWKTTFALRKKILIVER